MIYIIIIYIIIIYLIMIYIIMICAIMIQMSMIYTSIRSRSFWSVSFWSISLSSCSDKNRIFFLWLWLTLASLPLKFICLYWNILLLHPVPDPLQPLVCLQLLVNPALHTGCVSLFLYNNPPALPGWAPVVNSFFLKDLFVAKVTCCSLSSNYFTFLQSRLVLE